MENQESKRPGMFMSAATYLIATVAAVWNTVTRDGTIEAIGREAIKDIRSTTQEVFFGQGELWSEPGTPLSPTQGEIAADRRPSLHGLRSPSEIAESWRGRVGGNGEHEQGRLRSPAEIAADRGGIHGPEHDREHGHEHGRDLGREM
jgi:hypothetical protein